MLYVIKKYFKRPLLFLFRLRKEKYFFYALVVGGLATWSFLAIDDPLWRLLVPIVLIAGYEIAFRILYHINTGGKPFPPRFPMWGHDIPFESHPYLPWVYKKNYIPPTNRIIYDSDRQGYMTGGIKTNNLRHVNGPDGGRDVAIPKPDNLVRIVCLGDSATCNYAPSGTGGSMTSWPMELEKLFTNGSSGKAVEVVNCGQGGYNTNEILIKFLIDTIDTDPDFVILYHAFVNVRCYLTPGFERDFFHFRRPISPHYAIRVTMARILPDFGLHFLRYLKGEYLSYQNVKEDHVRMINRAHDIDREKAPEGLETFRRNIETLIHACQGRGIVPILSTYQYFLSEDLADSAIHRKFHDIVMQENDIIRSLAIKHHVPLVDNQILIPATTDNYIDIVHPNARGMELMAQNFYDTLTPLMEKSNHAHS